MKLAIIGTRGIPNNYGGFEQFAEFLALGLVQRGYEIYVYNSHDHPCKDKIWKGVNIIHCFDPEYMVGTFGQFVYDLNCIIDSRKRKFDIILQLGYTSSSVWNWLLPNKSIIVTNMDGKEWMRSKYSAPVKRFLRWAEKLAVKFSDLLISDSTGIQNYLYYKYQVKSEYIPYGADVFQNTEGEEYINKLNLKPYSYSMLIARLEPENSIETILEGVANSSSENKFLVIGNHKTKYGNYLKNKFAKDKRIIFYGTEYNIQHLNYLRFYTNIYFHGHTVGGTNPSLLEAMASNAFIIAHNNEFNRAILGEDALYFINAVEVSDYIEKVSPDNSENTNKKLNNIRKINTLYNWNRIIDQYETYCLNALKVYSK